MYLNTLKPALGATKNRKRIGRGVGSGHGKTATKGHKGQKARSGGSIKAGFEGGQMPMQRRLPKRGFNPMNRIEYSEINVGRLNIFDANSIIDLEALVSTGLINKLKSGIKILGDGELTKPFTIKAHKFSCSAKEKILAAGGTAEEMPF